MVVSALKVSGLTISPLLLKQ